jgi:methionyl aminopeptidase
MNVTVKTPEEQEKMRVAGRLAASVLDMIEPYVRPGVTTEELDQRCHDFIVGELKSIPANLNYRGFPKTICTSVNHVVCHGIPGEKRLKNGDMINIDVTVIRDGFHGDTSRMYFAGTAPVLERDLP